MLLDKAENVDKKFSCQIEGERLFGLEELIHLYHKPVFHYCYHILRDRQESEDAVQEVFIKAMTHHNLDAIANTKAWLFRIAYNHCLNVAKRKKIFRFTSLRESFNTDQKLSVVDAHHGDEELDYILSRLNPKERAVVALRIIEDKSYDEIATILDIRPSAARKRFERVKAKIQKIIEGRLL